MGSVQCDQDSLETYNPSSTQKGETNKEHNTGQPRNHTIIRAPFLGLVKATGWGPLTILTVVKGLIT